MDAAYQLAPWHDLYVALCGATAALTGTLFVAISLRADKLLGEPFWRARVINNMIGLTSLIIRAALVLVPQSPKTLGIELLIINVLLLALPLRMITHSKGRLLWVPLRYAAVFLLGVAGGLSLAVGSGGGMYFVTVAYLVHVALAVANVLALLGVYEADHSKA